MNLKLIRDKNGELKVNSQKIGNSKWICDEDSKLTVNLTVNLNSRTVIVISRK